MLRKDGSVYRLREPKTNTQVKLDKLVLHNCSWNKTETTPVENSESPSTHAVVNFKEEEKKETPVEAIAVPNNLLEKLIKTTKQELKEVKQVKEPQPVIAPIPTQSVEQKDMQIAHVLPGKRMKKESVFGEIEYEKIYEKNYQIKFVLLDQDALTMKFWCESSVPKYSIVYPFRSSSGKSLNQFDWWEVENIEPAKTGFFIYCILSDFQPAFS